VDKYARPESGPGIGRAGGKIAKFRVKREGQEPPQISIQALEIRVRLLQGESRAHSVQS